MSHASFDDSECYFGDNGGLEPHRPESFGYRPATVETELKVDRRFARFHHDATDPGRVRIVRPGEHRDEFAAIYDRYRRSTPGGLQRPLPRWDDLLADWEDSRGGGMKWFSLLHSDGYLLYRGHRGESRSVRVEEFAAATSEAHTALWRALLAWTWSRRIRSSVIPPTRCPIC